jgi:hypothetical protein
MKTYEQETQTMKPIPNAQKYFAAFAAAILFAFTTTMNAQVKTQTTTTSGTPAHEVSVERGEVVHVSGNDLVVKMEDGSLRDFHNVPESARVAVDGQKLGIHDLKPGMKLERTTTITTTPQTITTTKTVTGKVWQVTPPTSVVLTLENGTNEKFSIPKGQKFTINGEQTDAWGLKKGMTVTATKIVEQPATVVEHQRQVTGTLPPPPMPPAPDLPILVANETAQPTLAQATPPAHAEPKELPKTGSTLPLIGLMGAIAIVCSFVVRTMRKFL